MCGVNIYTPVSGTSSLFLKLSWLQLSFYPLTWPRLPGHVTARAVERHTSSRWASDWLAVTEFNQCRVHHYTVNEWFSAKFTPNCSATIVTCSGPLTSGDTDYSSWNVKKKTSNQPYWMPYPWCQLEQFLDFLQASDTAGMLRYCCILSIPLLGVCFIFATSAPSLVTVVPVLISVKITYKSKICIKIQNLHPGLT